MLRWLPRLLLTGVRVLYNTSSCPRSEQNLCVGWDSSHSCVCICYVRSGSGLERNSPDSFEEVRYHVRRELWDYERSRIPSTQPGSKKTGIWSYNLQEWNSANNPGRGLESQIRSQSCSHLVFPEHTLFQLTCAQTSDPWKLWDNWSVDLSS